MTDRSATNIDSDSAALVALGTRTDLAQYGDVRLGLFALETHFGIDDIEAVASDAVTDGPGDKKCDLLYIDRDAGIAVVAQVYMAREASGHEAPANKASDLNTAAVWVLGSDIPDAMPDVLRSAADELKDALRQGELDFLYFWYVHNLRASENVTRELAKAAETARALIEAGSLGGDLKVQTLEVDAALLDRWYASTQSSIQVADVFRVPTDSWTNVRGEVWNAVSTTVPASWLRDLVKEHGDELYSANIRGYMPSRRSARNINHNIEQSATQDGDNFWAFNNGVTALVHTIDSGEVLSITGLAIVNGAQTTGAIGKTGEDLDERAQVPIRFVACSDEALVERIIRFNNSQNPIKPSDFRSMDRHQERLRLEFSAIPDSMYLGARRGGLSDRARRPSNLVSSDTAAQALACFHGEPGVAYHGLRTIWERDDVYARYFSEQTTAIHIVFAYALMKAVQSRKANLAALPDSEITTSQEMQLAFMRRRGAMYLATAAIAGCIESYLGRRVPDLSTLSFSVETSPADAEQYWRPVVDVSIPFVSQLDVAVESGGLRDNVLVDREVAKFAAMVEATRGANALLYDSFAQQVESIT